VGEFRNGAPHAAPLPRKTPPAPSLRAWQAIRINRILEEPLRQPRRLGMLVSMDELKTEFAVLTWLLWIDMALLLACLSIVVLREFG
jgi:hypothetical protein